MKGLSAHQVVEGRIITIRGQRVMLDADLAIIYGVETKYLNRQVKRNPNRFPEEIAFQLTRKERDEVVTNWHHLTRLKYSYQMPMAYTEHGVCMLSSVLNSEAAIRISLHIVKTFVRLREFVSDYSALAAKLLQLEEKVGSHDEEIKALLGAIQEMLKPPRKPKRQIGFHAKL